MIKLSHVGIAVKSVKEAVPRFARIFGFSEDSFRCRIVPDEGVSVAEKIVGGVEIELLEPIGNSSPIQGFLERRGEGIHHLCFEVDDIYSHFERMRSLGVRLLSDEVSATANYHYFFIHPKDSAGVLLEFKQILKEEGNAQKK